jgi:hypothetical protein
MRAWRFYDHFRTDRDAPARRPQIGTRTPVLAGAVGHQAVVGGQVAQRLGPGAGAVAQAHQGSAAGRPARLRQPDDPRRRSPRRPRRAALARTDAGLALLAVAQAHQGSAALGEDVGPPDDRPVPDALGLDLGPRRRSPRRPRRAALARTDAGLALLRSFPHRPRRGCRSAAGGPARRGRCGNDRRSARPASVRASAAHGADVAAAIRTIIEIGDRDALDATIAEAFPGAELSVARVKWSSPLATDSSAPGKASAMVASRASRSPISTSNSASTDCCAPCAARSSPTGRCATSCSPPRSCRRARPS